MSIWSFSNKPDISPSDALMRAFYWLMVFTVQWAIALGVLMHFVETDSAGLQEFLTDLCMGFASLCL